MITSPLLRLPAELRNKIYEYAIYDGYYRHKLVPYQPPSLRPEDRRTTIGPAPTWKGLVATSRQIHAEAASLPYELNTIYMAGRGSFHQILAQLAALKSPVTSLRVEIQSHKEVWARKPATRLPGLKKVEVVLGICGYMYHRSKYGGLDELDGLDVLGDLDGEDNIDSLQADVVEWLEDIIDGHVEVTFAMRDTSGDWI